MLWITPGSEHYSFTGAHSQKYWSVAVWKPCGMHWLSFMIHTRMHPRTHTYLRTQRHTYTHKYKQLYTHICTHLCLRGARAVHCDPRDPIVGGRGLSSSFSSRLWGVNKVWWLTRGESQKMWWIQTAVVNNSRTVWCSRLWRVNKVWWLTGGESQKVWWIQTAVVNNRRCGEYRQRWWITVTTGVVAACDGWRRWGDLQKMSWFTQGVVNHRSCGEFQKVVNYSRNGCCSRGGHNTR
jgi:hypothetical protein